MADTTRTEKVVTTTEARYTLEMSQEEYEYLRALMEYQTSESREGVAGAIYSSLASPGQGQATKETPRVGDRVRTDDGRTGTLTHIDTADGDLPYMIRYAAGKYDWVSEVTPLPTFRDGDLVTVLPNAMRSSGSSVPTGHAVVISEIDEDGDVYVRYLSGRYSFVLPEFLVRR